MSPVQIIPPLLLLTGLIWGVNHRLRPADEGPATGAGDPGHVQDSRNSQEFLLPTPGEIAAEQARVRELVAQEEFLQARARAVESRPRELKGLETAYVERWRGFLAKHNAMHQQQVAEARATPGAHLFCVVCDGSHHAGTCVVCLDRPRECPTCFGSGFGTRLDPCPSCEGNKLCPMCNGSLRMLCPYCDDGVVDPDLPPPKDDFRLP